MWKIILEFWSEYILLFLGVQFSHLLFEISDSSILNREVKLTLETLIAS